MWSSPSGYVPRKSEVPRWRCRIVRRYPHDPEAFTQGLVVSEGILYEGTGLVGRSSIRRVALETGRILARRPLPPPHFGEGVAVVDDSIIQLTWLSEAGFVYDRESLEPRGRFRFSGEGWGLAHDGTRLVMSDGTPWLRFLDPATFAEGSRLRVTDAGRPLHELNALAWVEGELLANVWGSEFIARIDPDDGRVRGWIDCRGLLPPAISRYCDVLNGIAYDPAERRLLLTGKLWPWLFEVELVPAGRTVAPDSRSA